MLSERMATIDCNVTVELDLNAMEAGDPDIETLRQLFSELEFTSLLKELLPVVEVTEAQYGEAKSAADVEAVLKRLPSASALTIAVEAADAPTESDQEEEPEFDDGMLPLQICAPLEAALPSLT